MDNFSEAEEYAAVLARRSGTPSPEPRLTPTRELFPAARQLSSKSSRELFPGKNVTELFPAKKELLPMSKELLPPKKEQFPTTQRKLFPHERVAKLSPTAQNDSFISTRELFPALHRGSISHERASGSQPATKTDLFPISGKNEENAPMASTRELEARREWLLNSKRYTPEPQKELDPTSVKDKKTISMAASQRAKASEGVILTSIRNTPKPQKELMPKRMKEKEGSSMTGLQKEKAKREGILNSRWTTPEPQKFDHNLMPHEQRRVMRKSISPSQSPEVASGSAGIWQHDLFHTDNWKIPIPYPRQQRPHRSRASTPFTSTESIITPPNQRAGNQRQASSTISKPSKTASKRAEGLEGNNQEGRPSHPTGAMNGDSQPKTSQPHDNNILTPTPARSSSPESTVRIVSASSSTPNLKRRQVSAAESGTPKSSKPQSASATSSTPRQRPEANDIVARRLIGSALGVRMPKRTDDRSVEIAQEMLQKRVSNRNVSIGVSGDAKRLGCDD